MNQYQFTCIDLHVPRLLSGNSYNEIGKSLTLRFRATKTMKVFCRVSVQNDENITVDSKQVTIIPELGMCISVIMEVNILTCSMTQCGSLVNSHRQGTTMGRGWT